MIMRRKKKYPFWFEEPFERLRRMEDEIHRMMREMWKEPFAFKLPEFRREFARSIPIDIGETDSEILLRAELPGFSKDEIKLKITPNSIDIAAEKKKEKIEKGEKFYRREKSYGFARRVMSFPEDVKTEGARAKFENGVLEITLPKKEIKRKKEEKEVKIE